MYNLARHQRSTSSFIRIKYVFLIKVRCENSYHVVPFATTIFRSRYKRPYSVKIRLIVARISVKLCLCGIFEPAAMLRAAQNFHFPRDLPQINARIRRALGNLYWDLLSNFRVKFLKVIATR